MASVKSLGLHQPSGLQRAIDEQLLPPNPPPDSYKWDILPDDTDSGHFEDEILTTRDTVIWCRGGLFRKSFKFNLEKEPIVQALFAYFPTSADEKAQADKAKDIPKQINPLEKALVVFLKTQAHIYFLSGTSHTVYMPFEAESAHRAPVGVIIQRKYKADNAVSFAPKFPAVPPNSFVSSQLTTFNSSQLSAFSTENLGNPKPLKFELGSTLGKDWDTPGQKDSPWPRLVTLTDPLLDIGLVVTDPERGPRGKKAALKKPVFLNPADEILHIEQVKVPGAEDLALVITINREANSYTVWRLTYFENEDPFIKKSKKSRRSSIRRRSSMQPGRVSDIGTPGHPGFRESLGAPLPGKRGRKSEKVEKPLDLGSLEKEEKESSGVTRRSSRRVSSMLARADLSASHERFHEGSGAGHGASRKHDSLGANSARMSASFNNQIHPSLGSLLEAPFDVGLDEGFGNMGLEDHALDGLQNEVMLTKIHSVEWESQSFRYSTSASSDRPKPKVFILTAPPFANNEPSKGQLLIGVQDHADKRLQLIALYLKLKPNLKKTSKTFKGEPSGPASVTVNPGEIRVAHNVVDSCKLVDGDQSVILVLSESNDGRHELSIQAPWRELTKITLPILSVDNTRALLYKGRSLDRDVKERKSEVLDVANGSIVSVRHGRARGVVDAVDTEGRLHQLKIQLQPESPQVQKVLATCKSVLPDSMGERIHAGWLHIMQWLQVRDDDSIASIEWSAVTILIVAMFLNLGRTETTTFQAQRLPVRKRRPASGSFGHIRESDDWMALEVGETANSLGCPPWMMNRGWEWALDEDLDGALSPHVDQSSAPSFMTKHIRLAREFMCSTVGDAAVGSSGFLPTALSRPLEARRQSASDIFMALHLLLEEEKLDIMTPEYTSPGRTDLRVVLCQVGRWLGWHNFWSVYELGIQEDIDHRHDSGLCNAPISIQNTDCSPAELQIRPPINEPPERPDVFSWIQSRLIQDDRESYPTPGDIFYVNSRLSQSDLSWDNRWDKIVPRTLVFKRFFRIMRRDPTAVEMVEAMQDCGMSSHFLETLPEAILVPLQDAISMCQPHPPSSWSSELLQLVNRTDISLALASSKVPRQTVNNILVRPTLQVCAVDV